MFPSRTCVLLLLFAIFLAAACPGAARAATDDRRFVGEFGPLFGNDWADADLVGNGTGPDASPFAGARWASRLSPRWNWFADGSYMQHDSPVLGEDSKIFEGRTGFERLFPLQSGKANFFLSGALGGSDVNHPQGLEDFGRPLLSFGLGLAQDRGGLRGEIRAEQLLGDAGINGADITNVQIVVGWMFPFFSQEQHPALFEHGEESLVLEGVHFEFNSAQLTRESYEILDHVAGSLRDWPKVRVEIQGHTDEMGTPAYNQDLSQRRAESVRDYLISKGVKASRLEAKGYGETRPIAGNTTDEGRAKNRRVELKKLSH